MLKSLLSTASALNVAECVDIVYCTTKHLVHTDSYLGPPVSLLIFIFVFWLLQIIRGVEGELPLLENMQLFLS